MKTMKTMVEMDEYANINGTSLQGYFPDGTKYSELVAVFGKPNCKGDEYKIDAEWAGFISFGEVDNDGCYEHTEVFTIYNYKDGKNYLGEEGQCVWDITDWHIGGRNKQVVAEMIQHFNHKLKKLKEKKNGNS